MSSPMDEMPTCRPQSKNMGYASEVLQNQSDLNQVGQSWVMMFREDKTNKLPGRGAEEQHDPEKG
jgi:hypothetical protein